MGTHEESSEGGGQPRRPSKEGYRWECPVCETSRVNRLSERGRNALRALKAHVYLTEGGGHGEHGSYPEEIPEDALARFVRPVNDEGT